MRMNHSETNDEERSTISPARSICLTGAGGCRTLLQVECRACGAVSATAGGERIGFRDRCERCNADLHVCVQCSHHDVGAYNECREPSAERVGDRERANRCEYFRPRASGGVEADAPGKGDGLAAAEALFKKS